MGIKTCSSCWASCPPALTPHCNQSLPAPRLDWGSYLEGLRDLLALKFLMQLQNFSAIREIVTDVSSWSLVNAFYSFYTASLTQVSQAYLPHQLHRNLSFCEHHGHHELLPGVFMLSKLCFLISCCSLTCKWGHFGVEICYFWRLITFN